MSRWRIGRSIKALRRMHGWTQGQLGSRIGTSRDVVSRIENDRLDNIPIGKLQACAEALGAWLRFEVTWQGERLPRLLDARHAWLQDRFVRMLESWGWVVRVEVSFNEYGDRGRIDILAWHPATRILAVVEIKPEIGDAQDTIGRLDVKRRIAPRLVHELGWEVQHIVPILVLEESTTQRRHVASHAGLFRRYELRGRQALSWLRRPAGRVSGILLLLESAAAA